MRVMSGVIQPHHSSTILPLSPSCPADIRLWADEGETDPLNFRRRKSVISSALGSRLGDKCGLYVIRRYDSDSNVLGARLVLLYVAIILDEAFD